MRSTAMIPTILPVTWDLPDGSKGYVFINPSHVLAVYAEDGDTVIKFDNHQGTTYRICGISVDVVGPQLCIAEVV